MDMIAEHQKKMQEYKDACEKFQKNKEALKEYYQETKKRIEALHMEVDFWTGKAGNIQLTPQREPFSDAQIKSPGEIIPQAKPENKRLPEERKTVSGNSYCPKCGNYVGTNRFCSKCGAKVND